jgi:pantoate--beta-alanine ligase
MKIIKTKKAMSEISSATQRQGKSISFVPTMGALHEGHLSLVRKAKTLSDIVVVSIYVNPTQFGANEDFSRYPRPFENDCKLLRNEGVDFLFTPETMYDDGSAVTVDIGSIGNMLCGKSRPNHFRGVATVVLKFFNIVKPDFSLFGQKDAQQVAVIKQMVKDLDISTKVIVVPTVREKDGLAISSRNRYLSVKERSNAVSIYAALKFVRTAFVSGKCDSETVLKSAAKVMKGRCEYIAAVDPSTLQTAKKLKKGLLILAVMHLGKTRLIDNIFL